jgi:hypothetical protein
MNEPKKMQVLLVGRHDCSISRANVWVAILFSIMERVRALKIPCMGCDFFLFLAKTWVAKSEGQLGAASATSSIRNCRLPCDLKYRNK